MLYYLCIYYIILVYMGGVMYHFIINPNSRSSRGLFLWEKIKSRLEEKNIEYLSHITSHSKDASKIVSEITINNTKTIIIVVLGGDGTLNEVINGVTSFKNVILGYIPIGSSNDFARSLRLSTKPLEALNTILNPKYFKSIDYGILTTDEGTKNFIVSSGIGYDASVCLEINHSPIKKLLNKIGLGKFTYAALGIKQIFDYKPSDTTIILNDQEKILVKNMLFCSIHNLKYEGGGFLFCPHADCTDNTLDICVVENVSILKILLLLPLAFFGKHLLFKGIKNYKCNKIVVFSNSALPVHTDGEPIKKQIEISATCSKEKIRIITG